MRVDSFLPRHCFNLLSAHAWSIPLIIVALITTINALCLTGLYADGAYHLQYVLHYHTFTGGQLGIHQARSFGIIAYEWPVVLALKCGMHDRQTLMILYSLGVYGMPAVAWLFGFWSTRHTPLIWLGALLFAIWLNGIGFGVGEYNFAYALVGASAILLLKPEITRLDRGFLYIAGIALMLSYEAVALLTPILVLLAWRKDKPAAILFIVATVMMGWHALHPEFPGQAADARRVSEWIANRQLVITAGVALLIMLRLWYLAIPVALLLLWHATWSSIYQDQRVRLAIGLLLGATIILYWCLRPKLAPVAVLALLCAVGLNATRQATQFHAFLDNFRTALRYSEPGTRIGHTRLWSDPNVWPWGNPCLSLLLREQGSNAMILDWSPNAMESNMRAVGANIPQSSAAASNLEIAQAAGSRAKS